MYNEILRKITSLSLLTILLTSSAAFAVPNALPQAHASTNANLFVSAENSQFNNYFAGPQVVQVVVSDPDIQRLDQVYGEPVVTVNGKRLRMAQGTDGNWYAYLADRNSAVAAANTATVSGKGLNFGGFCSSGSTTSGKSGVNYGETKGFTVARGGFGSTTTANGTITNSFPACSNTPNSSLFTASQMEHVIRENKTINMNNNGFGSGAITYPQMWPVIQLYDFSGFPQTVTIDYAKAGGDQISTLTFDRIPQSLVSSSVDRTAYPPNSQVFITINDPQLNIDPTEEDSWTWAANAASNQLFYMAFNRNGQVDADGNTAAMHDLIPNLTTLMFDHNGRFTLNPAAQGVNVVDFQANGKEPLQSTLGAGRGTTSQVSTASIGVNSSPVTFIESGGVNTGVFVTWDGAKKSDVVTSNTLAIRGQSATIRYNDISTSIVGGFGFATLAESATNGTWASGQKIPITLVDTDANLNSKITEHRDLFNPNIYQSTTGGVPTMTIGTPFSLGNGATNDLVSFIGNTLTLTSGATVVGIPPELDLGLASNYAILAGDVAGTVTNGAPGQLVGGNVGFVSTETAAFTFAPGFSNVGPGNGILGSTTIPGTPIGDAHAILTNIGTYIGTTNTGLACTYTHNGAIDLKTDVTHGAVGNWAPGVYCINGAITDATPGAVNFNGTGPWVFKSAAFTTPANAQIRFSNVNSNIGSALLFFAPASATLGASPQIFSGTILSGTTAITVGAGCNCTNARFISETAITIGAAGAGQTFSSPAGITPLVLGTLLPTGQTVLPIVGLGNQTAITTATSANADTVNIQHIALVTPVSGLAGFTPVSSSTPVSTPALGTAGTYAILSGNVAGVITNGVTNQVITTGNVGHTSTETHPFSFGAGFGDVSSSAILGTTTQPGTPIGDAHAAYTNVGMWTGSAGNNTGTACTFTFANGAINLATDTTHGAIGQYGPGVYCIKGAASIGAAGINFNSTGTYIFKIDGALTTVAGSSVTFNGAAGGVANAGNLFWVTASLSDCVSCGNVGAFTSGANTQFAGTVMTGSTAITTGATTNNNNARFISESAITIGGGANLFSIPSVIPSGTSGVILFGTTSANGGGIIIDSSKKVSDLLTTIHDDLANDTEKFRGFNFISYDLRSLKTNSNGQLGNVAISLISNPTGLGILQANGQLVNNGIGFVITPLATEHILNCCKVYLMVDYS